MGYVRNSLAVVDDISSTGINTLSKGSLIHITNGGGAGLYSLNKDISSSSMSVEQAIEDGSLSVLRVEEYELENDAEVGNTDSHLKSCKLLDFSSKWGFCSSEFILKIERGNNIIVAKIKAKFYSIGNPITEVYVSEVFCNNYAYNSSSSVFVEASRFKDTALLGCILSVEDRNKLVLNVLNSGNSTTTFISTHYISGNVLPHPASYSRSENYFGGHGDVVNIPFKEGASNTFLGCGQIFAYFDKLPFETMFRNGLYKLDTEKSIDSFIYPSLSQGGGEILLSEVNDRYLVQNTKSIGRCNRWGQDTPYGLYLKSLAPNIKGELRYISETFNGHGVGTGPFKKLGGYNAGFTPSSADWSNTGAASFNAQDYNKVYSDEIGDRLQPDSTLVEYYIKVF